MTEETRRRFRRWLWRPPRPHGVVRPDRNVSFLELFYDLVYVAVIAQAAHHLAEHVTVRGVVEFAVVFSLIWVAWVNGSLYVELHGRDDGRTRNLVFIQNRAWSPGQHHRHVGRRDRPGRAFRGRAEPRG